MRYSQNDEIKRHIYGIKSKTYEIKILNYEIKIEIMR